MSIRKRWWSDELGARYAILTLQVHQLDIKYFSSARGSPLKNNKKLLVIFRFIKLKRYVLFDNERNIHHIFKNMNLTFIGHCTALSNEKNPQEFFNF